MAGVAGLEPVTSAVTGQRSNQLSYTPAQAEEKLRKTPCSRQRVNPNRSKTASPKQAPASNLLVLSTANIG